MKKTTRGAQRLAVSFTATCLLAMTACSSGGHTAANRPNDTSKLPATTLTTLRQAWAYQDQTMDPATFYGGPGFSPMGALYEGLVAYGQGSLSIVPQLATKWTVSPDGKTYTFTLRPGVKFHDGTAVDSAAVKWSFQRFIDLKGSPSYMLADVASMDTPDPLTFVMHLTSPSNPMLSYLASFVGPKVMSPTLMQANAGKDNGATFLASHDAGSGPYVLSGVVTDKSLTLTAFPGYWGPAPKIKTIQIEIIPDITTEVLSLEKGAIDMVTAQVPPNLAAQLKNEPDIHITTYNSILKSVAWVKDAGFFANPAARSALSQALNRNAIAKGAYGPGAQASTSMVPSSMDTGNVKTDDPAYDPSVLARLVKASHVAPITIGYYSSLSEDALAAQLIQTELQAAGLNATVRGYGDEFFGFGTHVASAPEIMVLRTNADAGSPASWMEGYYKTGGGLTLNGVSVPAGDAALAKAIGDADPHQANSGYIAAERAYAASGFFITLADTPAVIYSRTDVGPVAYSEGNPFGPDYALTGETSGK